MNISAEKDELRPYLADLDGYPVLSREEERELAVRFRETGDMEACDKLIMSNLRFVVKVAVRYRNYGARMMDLIQEGNIGLMKAVQRFDPDRGYRLISYAVWWIKAYIQNFIIKTWSLVKIGTTQAQRKLFYRVSELPDPTDEKKYKAGVAKIAGGVKVTEDEVIDMAARLKAHDLSLDDYMGDSTRDSFMDALPDHSLDQEDAFFLMEERHNLKMWANGALKRLNVREKLIVEQRILSDEPITLKEIGLQFGVTRERARQIEKAALEKLKGDYIQSEIAAA